MKILLNQQTVFLSILLFIISIAITKAEYQEADYMSDLIKSLTPTPSTWSNTTHYPRLDIVVLSHNNIVGPLPQSLGSSVVRYLRVNNQENQNGFNDTLDVISSMTFLRQAWLNNNFFQGSIPNRFASKNLSDLQLQSNWLIGLVPPSLLALTSLNNISLDDNFFQGPIPVFPKRVKATWKGNPFCESHAGHCDPQITIGDGFPLLLTSLVNLTLAGNKLTGLIPESLTTLPNLQLLDISHNNLSGKIPKFSSKVKLFTQGNPLLGLNISGDGRGKNATHSGDDVPTRKSGGEKDWLKYVWIAGASVGFIIFIGLTIYYRKECLILVQRWIFRGTIKSSHHIVENFMESYKLSVPIKQYRYAEVKRMTNSFRDKLGQGGYGTVYKASLSDGRQVAVKVIKESKGNGEEFINEVASISRTSHVNIVSLLGFCYGNKRALIYEFMSKGSLDNFILKSGSSDSVCSLDWNTLSKIAMGIARGLEYLHQGCISRILHLDIKPQNILLDEDFCPKISDFGLAKICQRDDSVVSILGARGTIGYIAPEVFSRTNGRVSHKSDVYSYGMLILDMIGRRKNSGARDSCTSEYFPDWIYKDLEQENNSVNCIENLEEENDMVRKITMVSLWCIQTKPSDRPSISKVIEMLQGPLQSVPYPPKPFLYSPEIPILQTSCVPSSSLSETKSSTLSKNGSIKTNKFSKDNNEDVIVV
ncbi:LEAF RUST 10 DISEASE-RESISTANCE LOCUS RECEPTOR-LIKE PROTEIN KINASE-like 2.5 [Vicia villosa]|uniref:LEAF RUST 10 DISEASE-RESISTANCE LOCUS RECEPTOR-LIKE PROTEIN KINASE-like 2.5 n=1 Tax=Vicia villosa TaxID=3911 RepID=UPI00273C9A5F|nr:LEAF RUST 10 DISEASE-RESISTANCE LOCUS RECEPTOR-LIKE PROTEIN KINASE-like 2.5 [Vicia villosa]